MVDQLWLWCLETQSQESPKGVKTSIFTCFPRKDEETSFGEDDLDNTADVRQAIFDEANSKVDTNDLSYNLVALIVEKAHLTF